MLTMFTRLEAETSIETYGDLFVNHLFQSQTLCFVIQDEYVSNRKKTKFPLKNYPAIQVVVTIFPKIDFQYELICSWNCENLSNNQFSI